MRAFAEMIAPVRCVGCGAEGDELCARCATGVRALTPPWCRRCGTPQPAYTSSCPLCAGLEAFDSARSLVLFAEPARSLTLQLKRRGRRPLADAVGELLALLALREGGLTPATRVTWVPGGRTTRRVGFDHAALIAQAIARFADAATHALLTRAHDGPRQADVPLAQRRTNVADRFVGRPTAGRVLLVDDVYTTGSTAEACARALKNAGAERVDVITWARTPRLRPV